MEYHKIDEEFEFEGMKLRVIKSINTDCSNCYLQSHILCFNHDIEEMKCTARVREDKEYINYKKVETNDFRIKKEGFDIYFQKYENKDITLEIDFEYDGIESYCSRSLSLSEKEIINIIEYCEFIRKV